MPPEIQTVLLLLYIMFPLHRPVLPARTQREGKGNEYGSILRHFEPVSRHIARGGGLSGSVEPIGAVPAALAAALYFSPRAATRICKSAPVRLWRRLKDMVR